MSFRALYPAAALTGASALAMTRGGAVEEAKEVVAPVAPVAQVEERAVAFSAGADVHDSTYYAKCMMGGILSCGLTHGAMTPVDLVKCRMQTNPEVYKGLVSGLSMLYRTAPEQLSIGWMPTLIGYSAQGFCKFGFYEIFKDVYSGMFSPETAFEYRTFIFLVASASAEFIADAALCPWESVKVRMQTSLPEAKFPTTMGPAMSKIYEAEGMNGFFKGLGPLWGRQVPYTMVKFAAFEKVVEAFYTNIFTAPKESYAKTTQLGITFASGYIAGVFCAIVSHPADTIVSKLNQSNTATIGSIVQQEGLFNLATKGLGARIFMIGTLTGLQWWIYDTFKTAVGLKTTGGAAKAAPSK